MSLRSNLQKRAPLFRVVVAALALAAASTAAIAPANARMGGGFSSGSRGSRSFSAPPSTATAPRSAMPFQRTEAPRSAPEQGFGTSAATPRRFGFGSGLMAGLLGAGLFGMLGGQGFLGGIGSLLPLILFGGLIWLAFSWFRNRSAIPAFASRTSAGAMPGAGIGSGRGSSAPVSDPTLVGPQDFATFERVLSEIQYSYSREDFGALSRMATPEMLRHLGADIEANRGRNVRNDMSDIRLLQGDLAEAWREGATTFATVAMRFAARDVMVDRSNGRVVAGDADRPAEVTELWTFRRGQGEPWILSAIQQTR